jgi:hypothetical protein
MFLRNAAVMDEMKLAEALETLRDARRVKLKESFDLNLGIENSRKDTKILNDVCKGNLNISALTMMTNEDTAGLVRMLKVKDSKLKQYLNIFFAGNQ